MLDDEFSRLSRREEQDVRIARSAFNPKRMAAIIDAGRTGPCGGRDDPTRSISADGGEPSDDWSCRLTVSHYDPGSDHQCALGGDAHPGARPCESAEMHHSGVLDTPARRDSASRLNRRHVP